MLGFSLQKLLVLAAVVGAVWYAFKFIGQLDKARKEEARLRGGKPKSRGFSLRRDKRAREAEPPAAEDMAQCYVCKVYVPAEGARSCGREDCPYL